MTLPLAMFLNHGRLARSLALRAFPLNSDGFGGIIEPRITDSRVVYSATTVLLGPSETVLRQAYIFRRILKILERILRQA